MRLTTVSRFAVGVGVAMLATAVGACASQISQSVRPTRAVPASSAARGTVTGYAAACAGAVIPRHGRLLTVYAVGSGKRITRQRVTTPQTQADAPGLLSALRRTAGTLPTAGTYTLVLQPGRYLVSAPLSADPPEVIELRAGQTVRVDFPSRCR